ncbi:MAG: DUF2721 domain-containing protein [Cytophagaceae bacterium]|nr:DUF2721 domain-containing protein [Gemmatimonadaceae bacterium]
MQVSPVISDVAHSIQLAVAPVFLLTGVGTLLNVLTHRLARIIDRARALQGGANVDPMAPEEIREELVVLSRRAKLVHRAISLSTVCALFICLVVVSLFARVALGQDLAMLIVVLFSGALFAFIGALVSLLLEVRAATASLHFVPAAPSGQRP